LVGAGAGIRNRHEDVRAGAAKTRATPQKLQKIVPLLSKTEGFFMVAAKNILHGGMGKAPFLILILT